MRRRTFFVQVGLGIAGLSACSDQDDHMGIDGESPKTADFRLTLDAAVDTIVPCDEDPGAVEAGVTDQLIELFNRKPEFKLYAANMLNRLETVAQHKFKKSFFRLGLRRREEIMLRTLQSQHIDDRTARRAITIFRGRVIEAYYLSPVGQSVLGYTPPYPGGYPDYDRQPST